MSRLLCINVGKDKLLSNKFEHKTTSLRDRDVRWQSNPLGSKVSQPIHSNQLSVSSSCALGRSIGCNTKHLRINAAAPGISLSSTASRVRKIASKVVGRKSSFVRRSLPSLSKYFSRSSQPWRNSRGNCPKHSTIYCKWSSFE